MKKMLLVLSGLMVVASATVQCTEGNKKTGSGIVAEFPDGKADVGGQVSDMGALFLGDEAAVRGSFVQNHEFHGYTIEVRPDSRLTLEITRLGSSRNLDTTLALYGPHRVDGGYGSETVAFDDDGGYGFLSSMKAVDLTEGGRYLVVVGTYDGLDRGSYRLVATCLSGACEPDTADNQPLCHPAISAAISACVDDRIRDPEVDPVSMNRLDVIEACSDIEVVAPAWDALCAGDGQTDALCDLSLDQLSSDHLPVCTHELSEAALDETCVFGLRYQDILRGTGAVVRIRSRVLTSSDELTPLEEQQIIAAVHATAYDDVDTIEAAFESVDDNLVNQVKLWDASGRREFVAYEVGAGDNSFGAVFHGGTTDAAAIINDGDIYDCSVFWGSEMRTCRDTGQCDEGLICTGIPSTGGVGRCVNSSLDDHDAIGRDCVGEDGCPAGSGLVCAGAASTGTGLCLPGWMRNHFYSEPALAIPDAPSSGIEAQMPVYGLATVDTDVVLDLWISHPRPQDLRVSLANPGGTEVVVFDAGQATGELYFWGQPVLGFPGDESVNGIWRLVVVDGARGETGTIERFGLTITSRWD